jgi:uncharacterized protein GlcG (DUF336 family)
MSVAYSKIVIGLNEARKTLDTMLAEAQKDPRPLAFAICDEYGDLIVYAHMDRCPVLSQAVAKKKAYTAARMRASTGPWGEAVKKASWQVIDFGDADLIGIHGGLPIKDKDGNVIGGIGVSGRKALEDEAVAQIGLDALTALLA